MSTSAGAGQPPEGGQLRCGRSAEDTLAQVADGHGTDRNKHQQSCPHCQAALAEYDRLWEPVREVAAQRVTAPEHLLEAAMAQIRGAVEHTDYGVLPSPSGLTRIAARVVVVTAREIAQGVAGVRVALSKHITGPAGAPKIRPAGGTRRDGAKVTAGVAGRSAAIEITLAADYGLDLIELGERVRREVTARVRALTDFEPVQVTVIIDDVFD